MAGRLEKLKDLEAVLERELFAADQKTVASIARQYRETLKEIEELEGADTDGDEIEGLLSDRRDAGKPGAVR